MSIPELLLGLVLPLVLLLMLSGLTRSWEEIGRILSIAFTLVMGEIGLILVARKWNSLVTGEDWSQLVATAVDKFVTPTIAFDWLPAAIVSFAISYLVLLWVVKARSPLWKFVFLALELLVLAALIYAMLSGSKYISREPEMWKRAAYVGIPSLLLWSGWVIAAFAPQRCGISRNQADEGRCEDTSVGLESKLGWLSALAIVLSASLLIISSGSASTAVQAAVASIVPAALFWERKFTAARSSVFWLHSATGITLILGYYFAEVTWYAGVCWFTSSCLLIRFWPTVDQTLGRRWLQALGIAAPALVIAFYYAVVLVISMSGTTSEY